MTNKYEELIKKAVKEDLKPKSLTKAPDVDKKHCKICREMKTRILSGKYDSNNKKWVDETGSAWNGRVCPKCHKNKIKSNMRKLRDESS